MSRKSRKPDSWITQQQNPITRQDSGSALVNYKKGDMPSWQGPTQAERISGKRKKMNIKKFNEGQEQVNIRPSKKVTGKQIKKTATDIDRLKRKTNQRLDTGLAPSMGLKRNTTLPSPPKDLQATYPTKADRARENQRIQRQVMARKKKRRRTP